MENILALIGWQVKSYIYVVASITVHILQGLLHYLEVVLLDRLFKHVCTYSVHVKLHTNHV